jgi:Tfp pilus assembly protein PilF
MTTAIIANLEKLLDGPRDNALLRYSLGNEWLKAGDPAKAAAYFRNTVERDPNYSAAWKLLGKSLAESGALEEALTAYRQGILVAEKKGDVQSAKEMNVFVRRLLKQADSSET